MEKVSNDTSVRIYDNTYSVADNSAAENISVFDEQKKQELEQKKAKRKKIMLGIGIGLAVTAGCLIAIDLRRSNSFLKNILKKCALKTKLGSNIKEGVNFAREARSIPMQSLQEGDILAKIQGKISSEGIDICEKVIEDKGFVSECLGFIGNKCKNNQFLLSRIVSSTTDAEAIQGVIELGGTGPTKLAQIISNEATVMTKLEKVTPELALAIRSTKSKCSFSRTFENAVAFLEESFPGRGYVLEKELSAGSMGATYLARRPDGTQIVVKMLKDGINPESLQSEQSFFGRVISKVTNSADEAESLRAMLKNLYADWAGELDLFKSQKYNQIFSKVAKRFSVAQIREISKNGQCLVMDTAKGIQMNKLIEILKDYIANPSEFYTKYTSLIEANPWLANPDKVLKELSPTILKTFDEQFLFVKKGAQSIMHGDPHTGNFFVTSNKKGKLALEFIDTDNCVIRDAAKIKEDLTMLSNYFVGNEAKVAEYFVNLCKCPAGQKEELIAKVASDIRNSMFGKRMNIRDIKTFMENMKVILGKYDLKISGDTTALKAQLQFFTVADEAAKLSGSHIDVSTILKDTPRAMFSMIKSGISPFGCIKDALKYAIKHLRSSLGISLQFLMS